MPDKKNRTPGEIITFYSFKGGVGRSMALANVAFIAAKNGLNVLVMDWDLEAPGLLYYFRGLLDPVALKTLTQTPGVLNLLWAWSSRAASVTGHKETEDLLGELESGAFFRKCVAALGNEGFTSPGTIDFVGAGAAQVETPDVLPYEDALAKFSWPHFYEKAFGGVLIDGLRKWAKSNYDLVLVDSRTGLADVAGLCTMQLPDTTALCLILNRQNIDGVAKVSGAIRSQRKEKVRVRTIPMRVARQETPEESDARARAIDQLTHIGGFSSEAVQEDLKKLAIPTDTGIPFYEVLAPFSPSAASNPALDPLTLNYVQLASELLGRKFSPPSISESQAELVRSRLQPRQATIDYIKKLVTAEPGRAVVEMQRLLTSAQEAISGGSMPNTDYLTALMDATIALDDTGGENLAIGLKSQAADIMRDLYAKDPETWRIPLVKLLAELISEYARLGPEAKLSLLEEIDALLANVQTMTFKLSRLKFRRRAAWVYCGMDNKEASTQATREINVLLKELRQDEERLAPDQRDQLMAADIDAHLILASLHENDEQPSQSLEELEKAIHKISHRPNQAASKELRHLSAKCHQQIAQVYWRTGRSDEAAQQAIQAMEILPSFGYQHFGNFASYISASSNPATYGANFLKALFTSRDHPPEQLLGTYFGRSPVSATSFLETSATLVEKLVELDGETVEALKRLAKTAEVVFKSILRRRHTVGPQMTADLNLASSRLEKSLDLAGIPLDIAT